MQELPRCLLLSLMPTAPSHTAPPHASADNCVSEHPCTVHAVRHACAWLLHHCLSCMHGLCRLQRCVCMHGLQGFRNFKVMRGARATSAFVEFDDLNSAMGAHAAQQGAVISSNDRGGIRVQYSKNPFGKKRDVNGQLIDTPVRDAAAEAAAMAAGGPGYGAPAPGAAGPKLESYQPTAF